jgi:hypothetical protein
MLLAMASRWLGGPRGRATGVVAATCMIAAVILRRQYRSREKPPPPAPLRQGQDPPTPNWQNYQPLHFNYQPCEPVANKKRQGRVYLAQMAILASLLGAILAFSLLRLPDTTPPRNLDPAILSVSVIAELPQVDGEVYWVSPGQTWGDADISLERSLELYVPLIPEKNCSAYTNTGFQPCGPSIPKLQASYHRPIRFCIVLASTQVPIQVSADGMVEKSVNDLYSHWTDKYGDQFTVNNTGWALQSIKHYAWDGDFFTMITGWINNTQNVSFTGSDSQLGVGQAGIDYLAGVPQFLVTWKGGDPVYLTKGPFLEVATPNIILDRSGPAAPVNQPLTATNMDIGTLVQGPLPPWQSYDTGVGALGAGGGAIFSTPWLGSYTPIGDDLPTVSQGVWRFSSNAMGRNSSIDTTNSYRLFTIGILLGVGSALGIALIQTIFSFWQAKADLPRKSTHHRRAEPLALIATILAAGTAALYPWFVRQLSYQQALALVIALAAGALLAAYGSFSRVPYRRTALLATAIWLTYVGVIVAVVFTILSIGLPILASAILALASILRPVRRAAL